MPGDKTGRGNGRRNGSEERGGGGFKESKIECSRVNNATRPGIGVSAETLGRAIRALGRLPSAETRSRSRGKKRRKEGVKERKKGAAERRREGTIGRGRGDQRSVPGACTIASPWRNNGAWMSHRVQSQTAISHRGISQGNDRSAVVAAIDLPGGRP